MGSMECCASRDRKDPSDMVDINDVSKISQRSTRSHRSNISHRITKRQPQDARTEQEGPKNQQQSKRSEQEQQSSSQVVEEKKEFKLEELTSDMLLSHENMETFVTCIFIDILLDKNRTFKFKGIARKPRFQKSN